MSERLKQQPALENLATRVNYSPRVKGAFGMVIFFPIATSLGLFERSQVGLGILPDFMKGRLFDFMAPPFFASFNKFVHGSDELHPILKTGLLPSTIIEIGQGAGVVSGTFDPGDFVSFGLGSLAWLTLDSAARTLHDSGVTLPIYRALKIKHKKFG